jgi:NAD+ synthase
MTTLYGIAACVNGRVANTCNLSENFISYSTKFGDAAGDFSPLGNLTVTEVKALGYELGLPEALVVKVPTDGMCGKTDEDNFGFTYDVLDKYIRTGICEDEVVVQKIEGMRMAGLHKHKLIDTFKSLKNV